jgi:phosphate/sulfate permease
MRQAKVDRYKQEKKNRGKMLKRKKIKKVVAILVCAILIGAAIGFPLGRYLYKVTSEKQKASATISSGLYDYWSQQYWNQNYTGILGEEATETDADYDTDASPSDADSDVEDIDADDADSDVVDIDASSSDAE